MAITCFTITEPDGDRCPGWKEENPGGNCRMRIRKELLEALRITWHAATKVNRQEAMRAAAPELFAEPTTVESTS